MGPLVLGTEFEPLLEVLRKNSIDGDRLTLDRSGKIPLKEIGTHLFFSEASPQTLTRIDVADERLRFGSLSVIGKRAHEIVGLFKVPRKETLWCSLENERETSHLIAKGNTTGQSRELLAQGTMSALSLAPTAKPKLITTLYHFINSGSLEYPHASCSGLGHSVLHFCCFGTFAHAGIVGVYFQPQQLGTSANSYFAIFHWLHHSHCSVRRRARGVHSICMLV